MEKRLYADLNGFAKCPYPLLSIYVLDWGDSNVISPLRGQDALAELMHNWYCARFGEAMLSNISAAEHLKRFADLVNCVPMYELTRTESLEDIEEMRPMVENHVKTLKR